MMENNRILIVDDDQGIRETYREILQPALKNDVLSKGESLFDAPAVETAPAARMSYELTLTERGEDGVREVEKAVTRKTPFAAAFVDMKMPGIDGAETARRIWAIDPKVKIVIVTAYSEYTPEDIIRVTGRDDIFYLRKPFNPDEIRQYARALTNQWYLERDRESLSLKLEKANEKLEDLNKNLQNKVEEKTALLIQSEKMASLGVLAAGVAHEINNPITFINGNLSTIRRYCVRIENLLGKYDELERHLNRGEKDKADVLLEDLKNLKKTQKIDFILDDLVDLAEESLEGVSRVREIVKNLKVFSRMDEAELRYADINEILETALHVIRNEIKNKVAIVKDYGRLQEIRCFPQKLSQLFMNILLNAAQAIEGKGQIEIVTRHIKEGRRANDSRVSIRISDTGSGIPREDILKIFDPFFTTKPVGQGTGLGLSISYDIIKAHGGDINVESKEGEGSTFTIILPPEARH